MSQVQIIEAFAVLSIYIVVKILVNRSTLRIVQKNNAILARARLVKKALNITLFLIFATIFLSIFGVDQNELLMFVGSALTIMGIALFAQWSILSNITSGIIIFFNHSFQLEDTISVSDKDYEIEGKIIDIGLFFVILVTADNEKISIPNSVFLTKMIKQKPIS
jgi:small-conductance mechanosensitive channel